MEQATAEPPSPALRLGRHAVGIMVAALANPMIYFSTDQVLVWLATWGPVLIATAVIYGLLALFLTRRARAAWPGGAIALAWVLLLLLVVGNWMNYHEARSRFDPAAGKAPIEQHSSQAESPANLKPFAGQLDVSRQGHETATAPSSTNYFDQFTPQASSAGSPPQATQAPTRESAEERHFRQIYAAHPDALTVVQSPAFNQWLARNPSYAAIARAGTADQVVEMFSRFKNRPLAEERRVDSERQQRIEAAADALVERHMPNSR